MLQSLSDATYAQYDKPLRLWWKFCEERNLSTYSAPLPQVLEYLTIVADSAKSYGTVNSYRSAISLLLNYDIGNNPLAKRFCKGVFISKPQRAKYDDIWDPAPVLRHLSTFWPNNTLSLEKLTRKLCTLLVLVTAQRLQTIAKIKVTNIKVLQDKTKIYIIDRLKTSKVGKEQPLLHLPFYKQQPELCVASLLQDYLDKTKAIRPKDEEYLFLTIKKPHFLLPLLRR